eukprot:291537_1
MDDARCDQPTSDWILATEHNLKCTYTGIRTFQYKYELNASAYYLSPETSMLWSWSQFDEVWGDYHYTYNGGVNTTSFTCIGGEVGHWGIGCSTGGGFTFKVISIYDKFESDAKSTICAMPGIPGAGCHSNGTIYYRTCSGLCVPTVHPTRYPSQNPTQTPSSNPSAYPSFHPTQSPTLYPTIHPTLHPSFTPTLSPSSTSNPTSDPSIMPTLNPSVTPTSNPSLFPSGTRAPVVNTSYVGNTD